jgi:hypothetical protein
MYLDTPKLINFSLSIDLDASLPQIGRYRTRLGTSIGNFGQLFGLAFQNLIRGPSTRHKIGYVGETLYCITTKRDKLTKNLNICISVCPPNVSGPLQQQGAILRSKYHRKQQRKKFPKARYCKP